MTVLMVLVIAVVILSHLAFMVMEMFFWTRPAVRKIFAMSEQKAIDSKALAANIGLYNGFLAAGLLWGLWLNTPGVLTFFLTCITLAGIYGGLTSKRSILVVQALPAAIGLGLVWITLF
jgi:putative membrane protein